MGVAVRRGVYVWVAVRRGVAVGDGVPVRTGVAERLAVGGGEADIEAELEREGERVAGGVNEGVMVRARETLCEPDPLPVSVWVGMGVGVMVRDGVPVWWTVYDGVSVTFTVTVRLADGVTVRDMHGSTSGASGGMSVTRFE